MDYNRIFLNYKISPFDQKLQRCSLLVTPSRKKFILKFFLKFFFILSFINILKTILCEICPKFYF
jgi:hypothetical protein